MSKDTGNGIVCAVVGAVLIIMATGLPQSNMEGDIGPRVFPYIAGGILVLCGSLLAISGKKRVKEANAFLDKEGWKRLGSIIGVLVVYVVALKAVGFLVPSVLLLFVLCTMFSRETNLTLWRRVVFALVIPVVVYVAFTKGLSLRMPQGVLEKLVNKLI